MFTETKAATKDVGAVFAGIGIGFEVIGFLITLVGMLAILFMFPSLSQDIAGRTIESPWKQAGIGFVALIVVPILSLLLLVSFVGALLGGFLFAVFVVLIIFAKAITGIVVGAHISFWTQKESQISWKWALLGLLAIEIVALIPIIGSLAVFIFFLMAFGALSVSAYEKVRAEHE